MKSQTVFIVLGIGAVGAAAWWYMKNKGEDVPPPTIVDQIKASGVQIAPLPNKFPLKEPTINTLPHAISDLKMNTGNTGIVPPLVTPTTVKPAAIPAIAPPPTVPKATATVSNTKVDTLTSKLRKMGLQGVGDAYSLN